MEDGSGGDAAEDRLALNQLGRPTEGVATADEDLAIEDANGEITMRFVAVYLQ